MGRLATAEPETVEEDERPILMSRRRRSRAVGTDQQEAFWATLETSEANVMLVARAGAGKSFSAKEGMKRLLEADPIARLAYVAFNRSIADEFQVGLPPGATATTMHSAGYAALRSALPNLGSPDRNKVYRFVDHVFPRRDKITRQAKMATARLVGLCKGHLLNDPTDDDLTCLSASHGVNIPKGFSEYVFEAVPSILDATLADTSTIDFNDMIWMPVRMGLSFPALDALFVDEAQDLDACQHALVMAMSDQGRMIVIGDPRQAIYGFRGADTRSMATLGSHLSGSGRGLVELPLTKTRRCPSSHVALAKNIVPDFEAMDEAPNGRVDETDDSVIEPGWMVLCRTNAPLVTMAFRLAREGVPVAIQGRDLGDGLVKLIESFNVTTTNQLHQSVTTYRDKNLLKLSEIDGSEEDAAKLLDQCECIVSAAKSCETANEAANKVRDLFRDCSTAEQGSFVLLSSIHRAKGREAEQVAIVEPHKLPHPMAKTPEARLQEANLAYVASTRSKHQLSFIGAIPDILRSN